MGNFGDPVQGTGVAVDTSNGGASQAVVDPHDPKLVSEILTVNPEKDAYADPPPPPATKYRAKLKLQQPEENGQKKDYLLKAWGKNNTPTYVTGVEASIIDPSGHFDGFKVFDSQVSTFIRNDTHKVATILFRLRKPDGTAWTDGRGLTAQAWMDLLIKALAGEPEIGIELEWEWSCAGCREEAKKNETAFPRQMEGMTRMPMDVTSKPGAPVYSPERRCDVNQAHGYTRIRTKIDGFLSLAEFQKWQSQQPR